MSQVKVTVTQVRPTTDVEFFSSNFTEDVNTYINETYINTGKLIEQSVVHSDDLLQRIDTKIFDSMSSRIEMMLDPVIVNDNKDRNSYNETNGITVSLVVEILP